MQCRYGKLQFIHRVEAVQFNKINGKKTGQYQNVYKCDSCDCWHLASRRTYKRVKRIESR